MRKFQLEEEFAHRKLLNAAAAQDRMSLPDYSTISKL